MTYWSHVQSALGADGSTTTGTSVAVSFSAAVGAGHLVCGTVTWDNSASQTLSSVTDNASPSNTYNSVSYNDTVDFGGIALFWLGDINSTTQPTTITAHFSASTSYMRIVLDEFVGALPTANPADKSGIVYVTSSTTGTSPSETTTVAGDLIYGVGWCESGATPTFSAGSGFTATNNSSGTGVTLLVITEYKVQSSAGAVTATIGISPAATSVVGVLAIKPSLFAITSPSQNATETATFSVTVNVDSGFTNVAGYDSTFTTKLCPDATPSGGVATIQCTPPTGTTAGSFTFGIAEFQTSPALQLNQDLVINWQPTTAAPLAFRPTKKYLRR